MEKLISVEQSVEDVVLIIFSNILGEPQQKFVHIVDLLEHIRYDLDDGKSMYAYVKEVLEKHGKLDLTSSQDSV